MISLNAYVSLSLPTFAEYSGFSVVNFNAATSLKTSIKLITSSLISSEVNPSNKGNSPNSESISVNFGIRYLSTALGIAVKNNCDGVSSSKNTSTALITKSMKRPFSS